MLHKLKQRKEEGFTIIEVLIVLAIAGLIILIVLLAVPALQRNGRNTAIKNDASALVGAISTFESNSDGAKVTGVDATGKVSGTGTSVTEQAKLQGSTTVTYSTTTFPSSATTVITHGTIAVYGQHACGTDVGTAGPSNTRANAVYYSVETSSAETGANNNKCIDG